MIHSLKRGSLFYIKNIQSKPPPTLYHIYRTYIKQSLKTYQHLNKHIGTYLFKLLSQKKTQIKTRHQHLLQIKQLIDSIKHTQSNIQPLNLQQTINPNPIKSSQITQSNLIKLQLQKLSTQRNFYQKLLYQFQCLHYLSQACIQSLDLNLQIDLRTKQQSKLVHLSFNISKFFTPNLLPRANYHSLFLLDDLQNDMEFQVLSEKDKQFVRNVVIKVAGSKKLNHSRYRRSVDYIKDPNAVLSQTKSGRIQILNRDQKLKINKARIVFKKVSNNQIDQQVYSNNEVDRQQQQEQDQDQDNNEINDEWRLINERDRNRAVRRSLQSINKQTNKKYQQQKRNRWKNKQIGNSLIFQILQTLQSDKLIQYKCNSVLSQQINQIIKRLFKLSEQSNQQAQQSNQFKTKDKQQTKNKLPLLEDIILEYDFIDQFVNLKKIIIL